MYRKINIPEFMIEIVFYRYLSYKEISSYLFEPHIIGHTVGRSLSIIPLFCPNNNNNNHDRMRQCGE